MPESLKTVDSKAYPLKELFSDKFSVDFYQREYVWQKKQLEDLIQDLSNEFLKCWKPEHELENVSKYDPYFMGEVVLSLKNGEKSSIIDGQQRITTLSLLLIYLIQKYGKTPNFPNDLDKLICSDYYGKKLFNLDIEERNECMRSLLENGEYIVKETDSVSVHNLIDRYNDITECWNKEINENNVVPFTYWIKEKIIFSKVWTNSDEFAYVIFETMNDRGLNLTQVEMLRSYLLAHIETDCRNKSMKTFDQIITNLKNVKLMSKSKAEFEFFKVYFRSHFAETMSQAKNTNSDFTRIGKEFHRWIRDNEHLLNLFKSSDYVDFINRLEFFSNVYIKINQIIQNRDTKSYLYLVVNNDYYFTLQPALILGAISYKDTDAAIEAKIQLVSKYITKLLTWRTWNHWMISQSFLEIPIYSLCKEIRGKSFDEIKAKLDTDPIEIPPLANGPTLNQQIRSRIRVLLSLITEIVARESGESDYMLNHDDIEVEHIWANHFEQHTDDCVDENEFGLTRNNIGDLLVLPKSFNASYGDEKYEVKVKQYFSQNILAQSLNEQKYKNNPGFEKFVQLSGLKFRPYEHYTKTSISDRVELYRQILLWNWNHE